MIGKSIGPYQILAELGRGGMGEVYRARDSRLNRDVAIKVLPAAFANDPERLARFTREAQTLAALNHPNIAHIHGLEPLPPAEAGQPSGHALIMEFVDGDDLSVVIARGPMPFADVMPIAVQIATALEAAHEQGIVHRDLKPANIKLRSDGTVKVLDFGLAKALGPEGTDSSSEAMNSPTLTARATAMGMIIGTAAYMAPEQAKGKPVDRRADIWAFGVVLYEMLTGRRAFEGEDVSTTLAAVLMKDPVWAAFPAGTPRSVQTLIQRCLERNPKQRLRDIGEARILLTDASAMQDAPAESSASPAAPRSRVPWIIAAAAVIAAAIFGVQWARTSTSAVVTDRVEASLPPPKGQVFGSTFALSPDGRRLVSTMTSDETGATRLWLRELSGGTTVEIPHTEGGYQPFWSPDGREIGFFADGRLKRVDLQGGPPQVICDAPSPRGAAWGPDNVIIVANEFRTNLKKVDARGGKLSDLTKLDEKTEKSHRWPVFLPGGKDLLFLKQTGEAGDKDDQSAIEVLTLATGVRTSLVKANSAPLYSTAGVLLFWREGALRGLAFDASRRTTSGDVFVVANDVFLDDNERPAASISGAGTLVYASGPAGSRSSLLIVDRAGRPVKTIAESVQIAGGLALSHDGLRVALAVMAPNAKDTNIWVYDLVRETGRPVTLDPGDDYNPAWSPDDLEIAYTTVVKDTGTIFRRFSDGRGESRKAVTHASSAWPWQWSKDGTWILFGAQDSKTGVDVFRANLDGSPSTPLVKTTFTDDMPSLSPDNRWLAYTSDETGTSEVYVRPFAGEGRWPISGSGGGAPLWRRDGKELYFVTPRNQVMAVTVDPTGPAFKFGVPAPLFRTEFLNWLGEDYYAPFADGQRFVVSVVPGRTNVLLTLVTNWRPAIPQK